MKNTIILGAGVTGLAAGIKTGAPIFEANSYPGGICHSYLKNGYRFETGGGHWIFGTDQPTLSFINSLSPLKYYQRKAAVFFPKENLFVPYPLQNNLSCLPKEISKKVLNEIRKNSDKKLPPKTTLADWLNLNFGETLCRSFFFPFHELYTAGLYTQIAPQDQFKTPISHKNRGYNKTFAYPKRGLSDLIEKMSEKCQINYNKRVVKIDIKKRKVFFKDGTGLKYKKIISTLPLNQIVNMAKINLDESPLPYTSVMVFNLGAKKGKKYPLYHWLYIPKSKSGFHRVGLYSNIDKSFLSSSKKDNLSLYIEKAYQGGKKPSSKETKKLAKDIIKELQAWQFVGQVEVIEPTWIEVAYTWSLPNSKWRERALKTLQENEIWQIGRYGRWQFQGILESIKEGLSFYKAGVLAPKN